MTTKLSQILSSAGLGQKSRIIPIFADRDINLKPGQIYFMERPEDLLFSNNTVKFRVEQKDDNINVLYPLPMDLVYNKKKYINIINHATQDLKIKKGELVAVGYDMPINTKNPDAHGLFGDFNNTEKRKMGVMKDLIEKQKANFDESTKTLCIIDVEKVIKSLPSREQCFFSSHRRCSIDFDNREIFYSREQIDKGYAIFKKVVKTIIKNIDVNSNLLDRNYNKVFREYVSDMFIYRFREVRQDYEKTFNGKHFIDCIEAIKKSGIKSYQDLTVYLEEVKGVSKKITEILENDVEQQENEKKCSQILKDEMELERKRRHARTQNSRDKYYQMIIKCRQDYDGLSDILKSRADLARAEARKTLSQTVLSCEDAGISFNGYFCSLTFGNKIISEEYFQNDAIWQDIKKSEVKEGTKIEPKKRKTRTHTVKNQKTVKVEITQPKDSKKNDDKPKNDKEATSEDFSPIQKGKTENKITPQDLKDQKSHKIFNIGFVDYRDRIIYKILRIVNWRWKIYTKTHNI